MSGDLDGLKSLLADGVISVHDGGGKLSGARRPLYGADAVARFFIGITKKTSQGMSLRPATVDGQPGVVAYKNGRPTDVLQFEIDNGRIQAIRVQRNPDKLSRIPRKEPRSEATPYRDRFDLPATIQATLKLRLASETRGFDAQGKSKGTGVLQVTPLPFTLLKLGRGGERWHSGSELPQPNTTSSAKLSLPGNWSQIRSGPAIRSASQRLAARSFSPSPRPLKGWDRIAALPGK